MMLLGVVLVSLLLTLNVILVFFFLPHLETLENVRRQYVSRGFRVSETRHWEEIG